MEIVTPESLARERHNYIIAKLNIEGNEKAKKYLAELKAKQGITAGLKVVGG